MTIIKVINILQIEIFKMVVHISRIHTKRVKNTIVMHKNNNKMGSAIVEVRVF